MVVSGEILCALIELRGGLKLYAAKRGLCFQAQSSNPITVFNYIA